MNILFWVNNRNHSSDSRDPSVGVAAQEGSDRASLGEDLAV